jgi:hypothetical protein
MFIVWLALAGYCTAYPFYEEHSYSPSFFSVMIMSVSVLFIWLGTSRVKYFENHSTIKLSLVTTLLLPLIYLALLVCVAFIVKDISAMAMNGVSEARFVTFHLPVVALVGFSLCGIVNNLLSRAHA